jgi:murein DD-endopeptidase MepM/ murein hydrolase activator NlpD
LQILKRGIQIARKMKRKLIVAGSIIAGLVLSYIIFANVSQYLARYDTEKVEEVVVVDSIQFIPPPPQILFGINIDSMDVEEGIIKRNENLSEILTRYNISAQTIAKISQLPRDTFDVRRLQAQKSYTIIHNKDSLKTAKAFIYHPNRIDYVMLRFEDNLSVYNGKNDVDTIVEIASGVIQTSLYKTVLEASGPPILVSELADVYAWVIDFFGLQRGDAFKVIYERYEVNGEDAGMGKILGAWFLHQQKPFYAVQFDQGEGAEYFDEIGNSLRKAFLKAPLKFSRISSRFSYSRMHPVLHYRRPHTGVDYAAPKGTPVVAIGDGTVTMASYHGGGGNTVKIKHNSIYTTGYLHLSGYGKGIKVGARVTQGQVIGYVGSTGVSTGPHLDFRFWKNGQPVDPLKVDPPSAEPISEEKREAYSVVMQAMISKLDSIIIPVQEEVL